MAVLLSGGDSMAAVYACSRVIDEDSRVISSRTMFGFTGNIFGHLICVNVVGNGSSLLMRKTAVLEVGGFESWLRALGLEGCEDELLQFKLASKYGFGCVPEYLIGYRTRPNSMSSDTVRMFDSAHKVLMKVEETAPAGLKPLARRRAAECLLFSGYNLFKRGRALRAFRTIGRAHSLHLSCGINCSTYLIKSIIQSWSLQNTAGNSPQRRFHEYDPREAQNIHIGYPTKRRLAWLAPTALQTDRYSEQMLSVPVIGGKLSVFGATKDKTD
jgi:hypothetical protein